MATVQIEVTTKSVPALWAAIQQVSNDLTSISMTVVPDRADKPAAKPLAARRARGRPGRHPQLIYQLTAANGGNGRKIAVEESLQRNGLTKAELLAKPTRRHTWQNSLKLAMTISAANKANGAALAV